MAVSSPRTSASDSPDSCWDRQPQGPWPSETLLNEEASLDVIVVDSSEPSPPALLKPHRDLIAYEVQDNGRDIEVCGCPQPDVRTVAACVDPEPTHGDLCICCGCAQVYTQHPLFQGGMCAPCKDKYLDSLFLYDDDGHQSYCSICGSGDILLLCESPDCTRCYCFECVDALVGPGTSEKVQGMSRWACFLCLPFPNSGLLRRRNKWRARLKAFCDQESGKPQEMFKTVPVWRRRPLRALCLFGDIGPELESLGFLWDDAGPGQLKHLEDVTDIVRKDVEAWGSFDLMYGSTPPLGQAYNHPPCWYLFQFHRLLQYVRPAPGSTLPFFWMFADHLLLGPDNQDIATRFLESNPVTIQGVCDKTIPNAVRVWSNIPAVERHAELEPGQEAALQARGRLWARGPLPGATRLLRACFLPLREYFQYSSSCP